MQLPKTRALTAHIVGELVYYTFPSLEGLPGVRHGFSTRLGGVSRPPFDSMNLSFTRGDDKTAVTENFRRICAEWDAVPEQVVISAQTHTANVRAVGREACGSGVTRERDYTDVDGLITDEPGVLLCTQYADCVPLLFADPVKGVVATSHSGWRGTVQRIGAVTVEKMCVDYGCRREDIRAAIGPSIGPCCFEVDEPVYAAFSGMEEWEDATCAHFKEGGKLDLDLWEVNRRVLLAAGVREDHLTVTDLCTRCHADLFWSHRVCGATRGSLAAFIMKA